MPAVLFVAKLSVHLRPVFEASPVGNDKGRIDLALLDAIEEIIGPTIDMRLSGPDRQTLVHEPAEWQLVHEAAVDAGDREHSCWPTDVNHLSQHVWPVGFQHHRLLGAIEHGVDAASRVRLHAHGIDTLFRPFAVGNFVRASTTFS